MALKKRPRAAPASAERDPRIHEQLPGRLEVENSKGELDAQGAKIVLDRARIRDGAVLEDRCASMGSPE